MVKQTLTIILLLTTVAGFSQASEFGNSDSSLIYSDSAIQKLKHITDSLNLRFRVCDLNKTYQSAPQAKANYISFEDSTAENAYNDILNNISFSDFLIKYKTAKVENELLVVKSSYRKSNNQEQVAFYSMDLSDRYPRHSLYFTKQLSQYNLPLKGKWVVEYSPKNKYSSASLQAFYFTDNLNRQTLPPVYGRMIQYSECLIDTSAQMVYPSAQTSQRWQPLKKTSTSAFLSYVTPPVKYPPQLDTMSNREDFLQQWESAKIRRQQYADSMFAHDPRCMKLLKQALKKVQKHNDSDDEFEDYLVRYYNAKTALNLKRSRIVRGFCSMDESPRLHALNIAQLAAETTSWEIFLKAHLDIMNDRFIRNSDGSYAWGARQTYIRELEVLNINVLDLLLGISLRIDDKTPNHYYGNVSRLGRALSETGSTEAFETQVQQMMADSTLDDYNRIIAFILFHDYVYHLNKEKKEKATQKLKAAINTLPTYLVTKING